MATKKTAKSSPQAYNFEEKLEKLEDIVSKMEDGRCNLDEAFSMFEKAIKISKECSSMLDSYERKIYLIKENKGNKADKGNSQKGNTSDSEHYLDIFTNEV